LNKIKSIAVDFDGTLCASAYPEVGKRYLIHKLIAWYIRKMHKMGCVIILNTLRDKYNDKYGCDPFYNAVFHCEKWHIPIDVFNDNEQCATEKYGYARKIKADRYLDDRNYGFLGCVLRFYDK
jgi:hypothetical protein